MKPRQTPRIRIATPAARDPLRIAGFTLIEVMITVAIIAIIAAVALPSYVEYLRRSKLTEAKTNLSDMRTRMEQYFLDNRAYPGTCKDYDATKPAGPGNIYLPASIKYFTIDCPVLTATTYTVRATGIGDLADFIFTVNQQNVRATPSVPNGWTKSNVCWISRRSGDCG